MSLGYVVAPVTVDNSEWIFAVKYRAADAGVQQRTRLGNLYVAHMRRAVAHARTISRVRFGREVRQILLIHANELNADFVAPLLDSLAVDGAVFIPLDEALQDSIYHLSTDYAGPQGLSWLYRVAPEQSALAIWDEEEERAIDADLLGVPQGFEALAAEIRARSALFWMLYVAGETDDLLDLYVPDGMLIPPGGRRFVGLDAIQRYWTPGPNRRPLEHRMHTEMLYGDHGNVTEVGRWFATSQQGSAEPVSSAGTYVVMWRRSQDGVLRMTIDTWHRDAPQ